MGCEGWALLACGWLGLVVPLGIAVFLVFALFTRR